MFAFYNIHKLAVVMKTKLLRSIYSNQDPILTNYTTIELNITAKLVQKLSMNQHYVWSSTASDWH